MLEVTVITERRLIAIQLNLALFGLLLFINILRDSIDDLSTTTPEVGRRRRRQASSEETFSPAGEGGLTFLTQDLLHKLPQILDASAAPGCAERLTCDVNSALVRGGQRHGRLVAALTTNVLSDALSAGAGVEAAALQRAGREGRLGADCSLVYPSCQHEEIHSLFSHS
ncbi:uncharacterized protein LOC125177619 [Hyalella azteca]|uniref:Uncharacterized protein LOC125177619 n=1 Tax=Hyalella azteca TaxID=294128 RepID=A0A979FFH5_HYAAZ|nr:uncharacterized protein LOC125177619 [Hyalella azteca]